MHNNEGVRDINNQAIPQDFEIDWRLLLNDTGDLPHEDPVNDMDSTFTPTFHYDSVITPASMPTIINPATWESYGPLAVKSPQIGFAANDKQANSGIPNDGLWNRGVPPTVVQRDVPPTAAPQTQLNVRMEREVPLQLAPASSGRAGGLQDLDMGTITGPPFVCRFPNCDKRFDLRSGLRAHMNRHEKPFVCGVCRQGFGSKKELQRHESSKHSDDKPFVCTWPQCKRSRQGWPREDNYHRHVRTVHHGQYGPTALPSRAGEVPNNSVSRKRRRERSEDDTDSDFRSTSRVKDEKIRDLEEICKAYKELYANSKEENIRLKEEIAQLKGLRASAA
ncbi:hypothetical protein DL767_003556 [Monosporascus sp. MG133]|nr:hypothetical protein DL767_003556 [Monosporascus sp. MG133]